MPTSPGSPTERPIVALIGLMGAGKSSVGSILASILKVPFVDTDSMVEESSGLSIDEIFDMESEDGFRRRERLAIAEAVEHPGVVIACGGGAVLDPRNVESLRGAGKVVLLDVGLDVAVARVGDGRLRPLLHTGSVGSDLEQVARARLTAYREAAHHIVDANGSIEETVQNVLSVIR